jgi:hypothetical protein
LPTRAAARRGIRIAAGIATGSLIPLLLGLLLVVSPYDQLYYFFFMFIVAPPPTGAWAWLLPRVGLEVGADGLLLTWRGGRRFITYADVAQVQRYEDLLWNGLRLRLASGEELEVPVQSPGALLGPPVEAVEQRIHDAMDAYAGGEVGDAAALLRRGGRDIPAWIHALRGIGSGASDAHRTAAVPPDALWRAVEDPRADADARAGAAVAIAAAADASGRERLLAVARAAAAPRLRIALEAAAEGRDEAISRALAELEAEDEAAALMRGGS